MRLLRGRIYGGRGYDVTLTRADPRCKGTAPSSIAQLGHRGARGCKDRALALSLDEIHVRALEHAAPDERPRVDELLATYFRRVPLRTQYALRRWPLATARVLHVGCALGTSLSQFGPGSVGLDNNPEAIAFCRSLGLGARFADVDDHDSPIAGDVFDYLWVADILEHREAPRLLLRELSLRLAPGGRLLLLTSVLPEQRQARWLGRRLKMRPFDAQVHYHQWTTSTLQHLLARSGYRLVKIHVPVPPTWRDLDRVIPRRIAPRVIAEAEPEGRLLPFSVAWATTAE